jgi:hypothetical protein
VRVSLFDRTSSGSLPQPASDVSRAQAALFEARAKLAASADAIFVREPLVDPHYPDTSDIDLLVFGPVDDLLPERFFPSSRPEGEARPPVDLIWLPTRNLDDPAAFAARGVLPHRLLSSRVVHDRTGGAQAQARLVEQHMFEGPVQGRRIAGILDLGFLTVQEIGITWDFPALALFWLHVAYAACLAVIADATRTLSPNVYSRPLDYARPLEKLSGLSLTEPYVALLRLGCEPEAFVPALRRLHAVVSRFPEPAWPAGAKSSTRYEYRYFAAREELDWRIRAAAEMSRRGNAANGVFYLRLMAYALARIPSVHVDSMRGETPAFLRPPRAIRAELEALCPEVVGDLGFILGGPEPLDVAHVKQALEALSTLRRQTLAFISSQKIVVPSLRDWIPFEANSSARDTHRLERPRPAQAGSSKEI